VVIIAGARGGATRAGGGRAEHRTCLSAARQSNGLGPTVFSSAYTVIARCVQTSETSCLTIAILDGLVTTFKRTDPQACLCRANNA